MEALHLFISVLFAVRLAGLIYAMAGRSPGVLGSFPVCFNCYLFLACFLWPFPGVVAFHGHTGVCSGSLCIRRLCIPFLLFFFLASGLPLYDLLCLEDHRCLLWINVR